MKNVIERQEKKFNNIKTLIKKYLKTNIIFVSYVLVSLFNSTLIRYYTIGVNLNIKPILADLAVLILVGSFGYLIKPKKRVTYYKVWLTIFTAICFINSVYYNNYVSFASFSLLSSATQAVGVANAITKIFELKDIIFWIPYILFIILCHNLKKKGYYNFIGTIEVSNKRAIKTFTSGLIILGIFIMFLTGTDLSRLKKQWNREHIVKEFGIYIYQFNDLISSLKPQISPLFGIDQAKKDFRDYYSEYQIEDITNIYTNKYKDKNILAIHAESIQGWLLNYEINGVEVTPTLNKLASEGLYFSNFYSQESVGTSSDTEFTFNTSLLPASSGTVFVSYWDRDYPYTTQKLLEEKGYYTFSMHGNSCSMWNRNVMYKSLGYDDFYCYTNAYDIDETIGIGLSDKSFFRQSVNIIKDIDSKYDKYYGTLIMLTNHTPWNEIKDYSDLDVTMHYIDPVTGESKVAPYLEGTTMGDYIKSVNYADQALGELIDKLDNEGLLEDTVLVIYGDHDSKLKKKEYSWLYNYDPVTDDIIDSTEENYVDVDYYSYEINRKVPFIIWSKEDNINQNITNIMGMYDVQPTLGNLFGFYNPYALGHDIFSVKDNVVIFPNGNWITNNMYYSSQREEGYGINNSPISIDEIDKYTSLAEKVVSLSNKIIVYDLFDAENKDSLSLENK